MTRSSWLVYPSIVLAFFGVAWRCQSDQGLSVDQIAANIATNPKTYSMAFFGRDYLGGVLQLHPTRCQRTNAVCFLYRYCGHSVDQICIGDETGMVMTSKCCDWLMLAGLVWALVTRFGTRRFWGEYGVSCNHVLLYANVATLHDISMILGLSLEKRVWQGVCMVTIGSLACWWVTRDKSFDGQGVGFWRFSLECWI